MRANTLGHAYPALSPARASLVRIPLGPCPSLHQLRSGSLRFVHRLPSYYDRVRLLGSVHHRLRLLTFPMRAGNGNAVPIKPEISQFPCKELLHVHKVSDCARFSPCKAITPWEMLPSLQQNEIGTSE